MGRTAVDYIDLLRIIYNTKNNTFPTPNIARQYSPLVIFQLQQYRSGCLFVVLLCCCVVDSAAAVLLCCCCGWASQSNGGLRKGVRHSNPPPSPVQACCSTPSIRASERQTRAVVVAGLVVTFTALKNEEPARARGGLKSSIPPPQTRNIDSENPLYMPLHFFFYI